MEKVRLFTLDGQQLDSVDLTRFEHSPLPLAEENFLIHNQLLHEAIVLELASRRQGTHSTLTKAEVSGGGRKPYRQKKTGRARQGSIRNPHYVGGGVCFGPKPNRNYRLKMNKQQRFLAVHFAFLKLLREQRIILLEDQDFADSPSTKRFGKLMLKIGIFGQKILLINNRENSQLPLSARNFPRVINKGIEQTSVYDFLNSEVVLMHKASFEETLGYLFS